MSQNRITLAQDGSATVRLRNVRLSFPALFEPRAFEEGKDKTYQATFLMPKSGKDPEKNSEYLKQAIDHVVKHAFKGKNPGADRVCLQDGNKKAERGIDGYADVNYCSSNSRKKVPVVDRDLTPLDESSNKIYAGCYVNATVRIWPQDNKFGKRVNAQLRAVQFFAEGDPFGETAVDPAEEFEAEDGTTTDELI